MRTSIQATNVVLNLAVVPNVILMPSNFVILDKKIEGYNNVLTTATDETKFGVNKDVNYAKPKPKSKPTKRTEQRTEGGKTKSNGFIDDYIHNNGDGGSGNTSNDSDDVHDNVRSYNERTKTVGNAQLPMTFFLSLAAGVFVSKKIFS